MDTKKVRFSKEDTPDIYDLWMKTFPDNERDPIELITAHIDRKEAECVVYYDEGEFIGFTVLLLSETTTYVYYFVVLEHLRNKGYGSRILKLIQEMHPGTSLTLNIEPLDEDAPNQKERERRAAFYIRNGFSDTGRVLHFTDQGRFTVMSTAGKDYDEDAYYHIVDSMYFGEADFSVEDD